MKCLDASVLFKDYRTTQLIKQINGFLGIAERIFDFDSTLRKSMKLLIPLE